MSNPVDDYLVAKQAFLAAQRHLHDMRAKLSPEMQSDRAWQLYLDGERDMDAIAEQCALKAPKVRGIIRMLLATKQFGPETLREHRERRRHQEWTIGMRRQRVGRAVKALLDFPRLQAHTTAEARNAVNNAAVREMTAEEAERFWADTDAQKAAWATAVTAFEAEKSNAQSLRDHRCNMCRPWAS